MTENYNQKALPTQPTFGFSISATKYMAFTQSMSREEIHNCARWFPPVLLTDEEYFNIGKGGACMHNPYLEIALFQQKKKVSFG